MPGLGASSAVEKKSGGAARLYGLRNRIVHEGLRSVPFEEAKAGVVAGLHAIHQIQDLTYAFARPMIWSGAALDLDHIQKSAGRISRLFED
jgi:hypothetical protein